MRVLEEPVRLGEYFVQRPHEVLARLRQQGPVLPIVLPRGLPGWVVTGYAEGRALLADPRLSKDSSRMRAIFAQHGRGVVDDSLAAHMLNSDPPSHTRLRKLVNKAFTARAVSRLRPRIQEIADELLAGVAEKGRVDLLEEYAFPLPITVICELLGVPAKDRNDFRTWSNTIVGKSTPENLRKHSAALAEYLRELAAQKRARPTEDLYSDLVHTSDEGDVLSEQELLSMGFLLLVAGHETTVNLIGNGIHALLRHPDQLELLRRDRSLLPNAIEEFLRFDGPVNLATLRFTSEPVRVGDVEIPAGEFVMVSLIGGNNDAARFPEPGRLDVTRQANGHLAFGHGIHYCVGAPLARLEGEIAIGSLLDRFDSLELDGEPQGLRWRDSTLIRGLETLPVILG